ncbi:hypothetical protein FQN60_017510, partial [Etheostoma spectabile]
MELLHLEGYKRHPPTPSQYHKRATPVVGKAPLRRTSQQIHKGLVKYLFATCAAKRVTQSQYAQGTLLRSLRLIRPWCTGSLVQLMLCAPLKPFPS